MAISTAFMWPAIARVLRDQLPDKVMADTLLGHYEQGCRLAMEGASTGIMMPSAATRRAIYERARRLAAPQGIEVRVCACKNADLARGSCHITGPVPRSGKRHAQAELFAIHEAAGGHTNSMTTQGAR